MSINIEDFLDKTLWIPGPIESCDIYLGELEKDQLKEYLLDLWDEEYDINDLLIIRYNVGKGFPLHVHSKITDTHLGDIVIYPPSYFLSEELIGGDLVIYNSIDPFEEKMRVEVSKLKVWTKIFIPIGVYHEVEPIISGMRYTFKFDIYSDNFSY